MIEFFFDISSPWTYLAFHNIQPLAKEFDEEIEWRPILVGGIFNTINPSVYEMRKTPVPAKAIYMLKDLGDWARSAGLAIKMPPSVFPVNSVKAMRGCLWLLREQRAEAVFALQEDRPHLLVAERILRHLEAVDDGVLQQIRGASGVRPFAPRRILQQRRDAEQSAVQFGLSGLLLPCGRLRHDLSRRFDGRLGCALGGLGCALGRDLGCALGRRFDGRLAGLGGRTERLDVVRRRL